MVLQDPRRSGRKGFWNRDLAQVLLKDDTSGPQEILNREIQVIKRSLKQRSCTSAPAGSWYKWSKGSSHRDPETQILHKLSNRILIQLSNRIPIQWSRRIPIQRSCTCAPAGSWYKWSKGPWYRDLVQVVLQNPDTSGPKDPDTEILYKWSYKILIQVVQNDPHTEILRQRSCTSATTGSWYKWSKRIRILKQRSCTSGRTGSS